MATAPRLLICCLSQSLSHPVKYILHNITPKENRKKKAHTTRKAGRDVRFFIKNTTRRRRVEIFNKTRRAWTWQTWTPTYLCFSFLVLIPFFLRDASFWADCLGVTVGRRGAIWRSPKYIMPVIWQPKKHLNTAKNRLLYNLHYVK